MNLEKTILLLEELAEKSKDCKDGFFAPEEFEIKISEISNYDYIVAQDLQTISRELWSKDEGFNKETLMINIIYIDNEIIRFTPVILRNYLKELKTKL